MSEKVVIKISGLGGQGIILAGKILGMAAVHDGKYVVQTQSYGAEARGSEAKSEVIISDKEIGFPQTRSCDILVAMSQDAFDKHLKDLKKDGVLIVDPEMITTVESPEARVSEVPATRISEKRLNSKIYANIIMLGALVKVTGLVSKEAFEKALANSFKNEMRKKNLEAFRMGFDILPSLP